MTQNGTVPLRATLMGGPHNGKEALLPDVAPILRTDGDDYFGGRYKLIGHGQLEPQHGGHETLIYQWTEDQDEIGEAT